MSILVLLYIKLYELLKKYPNKKYIFYLWDIFYPNKNIFVRGFVTDGVPYSSPIYVIVYCIFWRGNGISLLKVKFGNASENGQSLLSKTVG